MKQIPQMLRFKPDRCVPTQKRAQEKVRLILVAAAVEFSERGVEQTSTNHIAAKAQLPVGSVYKYFTDKEAIVDALIGLYQSDTLELFKEISASPLVSDDSPAGRIQLFMRECAHYHLGTKALMLFDYAQSDPRLLESIQSGEREMRVAIEQYLTAQGITNSGLKATLIMQLTRNYSNLAQENTEVSLRACDEIHALAHQVIMN